MRHIMIIALLGPLLLAAGCSRGESKQRLNAGGSTFVYPIMSTWASDYEKAKGVQINYQSIGSGGGIQQMSAKTLDFGCTDGPMTDKTDSVKIVGCGFCEDVRRMMRATVGHSRRPTTLENVPIARR